MSKGSRKQADTASSSNGRTPASGAVDVGSSPAEATTFPKDVTGVPEVTASVGAPAVETSLPQTADAVVSDHTPNPALNGESETITQVPAMPIDWDAHAEAQHRQEFIDFSACVIFSRHFQGLKSFVQAAELWEARKVWLRKDKGQK